MKEEFQIGADKSLRLLGPLTVKNTQELSNTEGYDMLLPVELPLKGSQDGKVELRGESERRGCGNRRGQIQEQERKDQSACYT